MAALLQPLLLALPGVLPPVVAAVLVLIAGRLLRRPTPAAPRGLSGAMAVGAGYLAGHVALLGLPPFPPTEAVHRVFYVTLAAALVGLACDAFPRRWLRGLFYLLLAVAGQAFVLRPVLGSLSAGESALWLGGVGLVFWVGLDLLAARPGPVLILTLAAVVTGSAVVLVQGGSALFGQLAGALLAALMPALLWAWRQPAFGLRGALAVLALVLPGLWAAGVFYGDPGVPVGGVFLLAIVPAVAWLALQVPARWPALVARVAVPLLLVPLAVLYAMPADSEGSAGEADPYENWPASSAPAGNAGGGAPSSATTAPDSNPFEDLPGGPSPEK